jgi:hypothetical protein
VVLTVAYDVMLLVLRVPSDDERQAAGRLLSMALRRPPGAPVIAGAESAAIPGAGGRQ